MTTQSFIPVEPDSHFPLQNLPFGVFRPSMPSGPPRIGTAIGDFVVDLASLARAGIFDDCPHLRDGVAVACFSQPTLNAFMALGRPAWCEARERLTTLLSQIDPYDPPSSADRGKFLLHYDDAFRHAVLFPMSAVAMELPFTVGDYTDFYSSKHHATNVAAIFRALPGENALPANWLHMPIAYHGRASSVVVSGTPVRRPWGPMSPGPGSQQPELKPCAALDFELEMAAVIGVGTALGTRVDIRNARDHVFGFVLLNDWSARDIQKWESVPLGPFLGKNFATSISPWVVTLEAIAQFSCPAVTQDPQPASYLRHDGRSTFDIRVEALIRPEGGRFASTVCRSNFRHLYWTIDQQLAHHTVGGCNLQTGDLLASGTISGPESSSLGCLLELSHGGTREVILESAKASDSSEQVSDMGYGRTPSNESVSRTFLKDGDEVILSGYCDGGSHRIGFGTCTGRVLPAVPL